MQDLGALTKVDLRKVWPNEASDFTPWLAEHLSALGDALGMELELQDIEAPVGGFALDLLARDVGRDRIVVIENQLESTDHDHLGKLLTYAGGYDASVIIWIAKEIRDEHRQALDWLNQHTDASAEFYGVVVEVVKIDESRPALNFKPVAFPNEWRKTKVGPRGGTAVSEKMERYRTYFQDVIDRLRERHQFTGARLGQPQSWYSFASGFSGITYGHSFVQGGRARAELYISRSDAAFNKSLFDDLAKDRESLEAEFGESLNWERLDGNIASRMVVDRDGTIDDDSQALEEIKEWAIDRLLKLKTVFGPRLAELVRQK